MTYFRAEKDSTAHCFILRVLQRGYARTWRDGLRPTTPLSHQRADFLFALPYQLPILRCLARGDWRKVYLTLQGPVYELGPKPERFTGEAKGANGKQGVGQENGREIGFLCLTGRLSCYTLIQTAPSNSQMAESGRAIAAPRLILRPYENTT